MNKDLKIIYSSFFKHKNRLRIRLRTKNPLIYLSITDRLDAQFFLQRATITDFIVIRTALIIQ
jgi:hypothetical protein